MATKTKTDGPTVPTQTFLDVFRDIATQHSWCSDAEQYLSDYLGLNFEPLGDDYCCADHSSELRFKTVKGTPEKLNAALVSERVKQQVVRGNLGRADAERLLALLPEDLRFPPKVKATVTFTVELEDPDYLTRRSTAGQRRYLGERLYGGQVSDFNITL